MAEERLELVTEGRDVSAGRVLQEVGRQAQQTSRQLAEVGDQLAALHRTVTAGVRLEITPPDALDGLRRDLERAAQTVTAAVRVEISPPGALEELRAELDRASRAVDVQVRLDVQPAGALEELRLDLERVSRDVTARVNVRMGNALRDLAELDWALMRLQYGLDAVQVRIDVDVDSIAEVRELNEMLDRIDRHIQVRIDVDTDGAAGAGLAALAGMGDRLSGLTGALGGLAGRLAGVASGFAQTGVAAGTLALKLTAGIQAAAQFGSTLAQMGASAGILAPAILMGAQAMTTFKLVSEEASKQLEQLKPQFDSIKAAAAEAFRPGFAAALDTFASNLPVVKEGIRATAAVFGELAEKASAVFSGPAFRADLAAMMETNTNATRSFGQAGIWLAGAFWDVANAARDVWENFAGLVEIGAKNLGLWVEQKRESGELAAAIANGAREVGAFVSAIWNFGVGLKALFGAVSADGVSLSERLFDLSLKFKAWATDSETLTTVTNLFATFRQVAGEALDYVGLALGAVRDGWTETNEKISGDQTWLNTFRDLGEQARNLWTIFQNDLLPALRDLGTVLLNDVLPPLASAATEVRDTFATALGALGRILRDEVVPVLRDDLGPLLKDTILPAVTALAQWIRDSLIPAGEKLAGMFSALLKPALDQIIDSLARNKEEFQAFAEKVAAVVDALSPLAPLLIALTAPLWIAIGVVLVAIETFGFLVNSFERVTAAIEVVIGWIVDLAAKFGVTRDDVVRIAGEIVAWFEELKRKVVAIFSDSGSWLEKAGKLIMLGLETGVQLGWDVLRGVLLAIPVAIIGMFAGAAGWLLQAGRNIVQGLINGLGEKLQDVKNIAAEIAGAVVDFFPNSPAKEGPLKKSPPQTWGENLVDYIGDGMRAGEAGLKRTASQTAGSLAFPVSATSPGSAGAAATGVSVYVTVNIGGSVIPQRDFVEQVSGAVRNAIANTAASNGRRTGLPGR